MSPYHLNQQKASHQNPPKISRRTALSALAASPLVYLSGLSKTLQAQQPAKRTTGMGLVTYCANFRRKHLQETTGINLFEPLNFLKHCHALGAGGMQCRLGTLQNKEIDELTRFANQHDLYIEAIVSLPKDKSDVDRFAQEMETAKNCGALAARTTIIPGRRYEYFKTIEQFREFERKGESMLKLGTPVAEKLEIPIAVENHKDQPNADRLALFERIDSQYVGACVDTGNSIALLEDPIETVKAFAPWAKSVHLKDQALAPVSSLFTLADVPLGQGSLDLKTMVNILRQAQPDVRFSLELITRDPLAVPCHAAHYRNILPDITDADIARMLKFVEDHESRNGQEISKLTKEQQLAREDQNVNESLEYASKVLMLK